VQQRQAEPFKTIGAVSSLVPSLSPELKVLLAVNSNYFRLTGQVRLGKSRLFLNSVLFRSADGKVRVIMRQFNRVNPPAKTEAENS
ncbi:MAG TPA: type II secretion system protein GspK, partial [Thiolinea sp.]|nr:type II secretion system protein GspK [Thiolinea sp.]